MSMSDAEKIGLATDCVGRLPAAFAVFNLKVRNGNNKNCLADCSVSVTYVLDKYTRIYFNELLRNEYRAEILLIDTLYAFR